MEGGNLRVMSFEVGEIKVVWKGLLFAGESASNKKLVRYFEVVDALWITFIQDRSSFELSYDGFCSIL